VGSDGRVRVVSTWIDDGVMWDVWSREREIKVLEVGMTRCCWTAQGGGAESDR
jgi:hypothetical protein